jgi:hypothetical protein
MAYLTQMTPNLNEYIRRAVQQALLEEFIDASSLREYGKRAWQHSHLLEEADFLSEEADQGNSQNLAALIKTDQWETPDPQKFHASLTSGKRSEMLTPYSVGELAKMNLFKVKDFNAGFAIKQDGDIVAVHNNTGVSGIGGELMKAAKRNGGVKLDHFDGFLTGFYERLGFKVVSHEPWNDDYAPQGWKYTPVDFLDPQQSVYAQLARATPEEQWPQELHDAKERYEAGKPDVVYRHV